MACAFNIGPLNAKLLRLLTKLCDIDWAADSNQHLSTCRKDIYDEVFSTLSSCAVLHVSGLRSFSHLPFYRTRNVLMLCGHLTQIQTISDVLFYLSINLSVESTLLSPSQCMVTPRDNGDGPNSLWWHLDVKSFQFYEQAIGTLLFFFLAVNILIIVSNWYFRFLTIWKVTITTPTTTLWWRATTTGSSTARFSFTRRNWG